MLNNLIGDTVSSIFNTRQQGKTQLMTLGEFVFELSTLAYDQLQRQNNWKHANNDPVGADPVYQFTGAGEESFTIAGVMYTEFGNRKHFDTLREMADTGEAYVLIDATGKVYGRYAIIDLSENGTYFDGEGVAKKTEFSIKLIRAKRNSSDASTAAGFAVGSAMGSTLGASLA